MIDVVRRRARFMVSREGHGAGKAFQHLRFDLAVTKEVENVSVFFSLLRQIVSIPNQKHEVFLMEVNMIPDMTNSGYPSVKFHQTTIAGLLSPFLPGQEYRRSGISAI